MANTESEWSSDNRPIWQKIADNPSMAMLDNRIDAILDRKNRFIALGERLAQLGHEVSPLTSTLFAEQQQLYDQLYEGFSPEVNKLLQHQESVTTQALALYGVDPEKVEAQRFRDSVGLEFIHKDTRILLQAHGKSIDVKTIDHEASFADKMRLWYEPGSLLEEQLDNNVRSFSLRSRRFSWGIPAAMQLATQPLNEVMDIISKDGFAPSGSDLTVIGPDTFQTQRGDKTWRLSSYDRITRDR